MKIAILGSTGFVGRVVLQKVLDKGYQVKTLVRNPEKLDELKEKVEFVQGSVTQSDKLEKTVFGTEVVISTIGPPMKNPGDPESYKKSMEDLVTILKKQNVKRYIHIGGAAHLGGENENWTIGRRILRMILKLIAKPVLIAKQMEWEVLKKSGLDWTLVRPPGIMKEIFKGKGVIADEKNLSRTKVNVEDLANFIVEQINSRSWIKKAPLVAAEFKKIQPI
ncbi:MAG: NAD(P)H-binding protein [Ignavibacteriaceae bacterium]